MGTTSKEWSKSPATSVTLEGPSKHLGSRYECLFMDNEPDQSTENEDLLDIMGEESLTTFESAHPSELTKRGEKEERGTRSSPAHEP